VAPAAWTALFSALQAAGFTTIGHQVAHAENDSDPAKSHRVHAAST
jgi:hypothetical protein